MTIMKGRGIVKTIWAALPLCLAMAGPAWAAQEDAQAWGAATATISATDRLVVWLEAQGRFSDEASRLGQLLLRPAVGVKLDKTTTAFIGYAYVFTDPEGPASSDEHRIWQQLSFRLVGNGQGVTVTGRTRFEQRFRQGSSDMGMRFRQLLRVTAPLQGKTRLVGWHESFIALDDTNWGQRGGLDRMRNFVGIAFPVNAKVSVEPGYMNEYVKLSVQDRIHHIASLTINTTF
jgi:hypothetical protein